MILCGWEIGRSIGQGISDDKGGRHVNGANGQFRADPPLFLSANVINSVRPMQIGNMTQGDRQLLASANLNKFGSFDLVSAEVANGNRVFDLKLLNGLPTLDTSIDAYWCPFIQGNVTPGFVDVPRLNPPRGFVLTAAMQGCALVVTSSPLGGAFFRVYHHQHPGDQGVWQRIHNHNVQVDTVFAFDEYADANANAPNAFNFLFYRNSRWIIGSQAQILNMMGQAVRRQPGWPIQVLDALP